MSNDPVRALLSEFTPLTYPNLGLVRFPSISIPPEERTALGVKQTASDRDVLKSLVWSNYLKLEAKGKFKGFSREQVIARLKTEFETFDKTGVIPYLLMVWDINKWADEQGIVRGWGRGSAGGSLTNFCLGIVRINPLKHNLDFPRFLSEARMKPVIKDGAVYVDGKSAPDIDCDYDYLRRADVVRYVETKYSGRTSKISTRLELTGKMALKDVLKTYARYSEDDAKRVTDLIEARFGKVQSLHEAKEKNPDIAKWLKESPQNEEVFRIAMQLEGAPVAKGQHPSGVFISYDDIDGNIPTEMSKTGDVVTSYDMETVAGLGIKVDLLGLRTLSLVAGVLKLTSEKMEDLDADDPIIYDYVRSKSTYIGLFQIEDGVTKEATRKIQPRHIDDLATILSIGRPGAMQYIDQFARYVKTGTIEPFYPAIDEKLKMTGGALIMQEQITAICRDVFGLSGIDADSIRYCVGKKKKEDMAKWEPILYSKGRERGIPEDVIKAFWNTCNASADYSFNASHAYLYVYLTAATIYLKAKYPQFFYLTMLQLAREEPNPTEYMNSIIAEMRQTGVALLPPSIIHSSSDFTLEHDEVTGTSAIRFGLASVKSISEITMAKLSSFRRAFENKLDMFDAARSAAVPINVLTNLIYSGCLQWPDTARTKLAWEAQTYNSLTDRQKGLVKQFAPEHDWDIIATIKALPDKKTEKGKPLLPESQLANMRRNNEPFYAMYRSNSANEELCAYVSERSLLGFSYSSSLFTVFSKRIIGLTSVSDAVLRAKEAAEKHKAANDAAVATGKAPLKRPRGVPVKLVAFIEEVKSSISQKSKEPYLRMEVADDTGTLRAMLMGQERYDACLSFNGSVPEEGDLVILNGTMAADGGAMFCDDCIIQANPIKMKKSDSGAVVI